MGMVVASIFGASLRTGALPVQKIWRVGIIGTTPTTTPESTRIWDTFRQELQDRGYIEGRNIVFERRYSEGKIERFPALAAELVRLNVDVIVVLSAPGRRRQRKHRRRFRS
jgi:putative ABC transport system substrate-binding protein